MHFNKLHVFNVFKFRVFEFHALENSRPAAAPSSRNLGFGFVDVTPCYAMLFPSKPLTCLAFLRFHRRWFRLSADGLVYWTDKNVSVSVRSEGIALVDLFSSHSSN